MAERGKVPYLEEENGDAVSSERLNSIRACLRSVWTALAKKDLAPQTWRELDKTGHDLFYSSIEQSFPLFRCAKDQWKLTRLAQTTYPAWRKHYISSDGKYQNKEERKLKRKIKVEGNSLPQSKKQKNNPSETLIPMSTTIVASLSNSEQSSGQDILLGSTDLYNEDHETGILLSHEEPGPAQTAAVNSLTTNTTKGPTQLPEVAPAPIKPFDPLDGLADVAAQLNVTIPAATSTESAASTGTLVPSDTVPDTGSTSTKLKPKITGTKKVAKMRPGPVQNGCNLCANRWLKQFKDKSNGSTNEFKAYYDGLTATQREEYEKEARDLVSKDAWNKDAFNGTMH